MNKEKKKKKKLHASPFAKPRHLCLRLCRRCAACEPSSLLWTTSGPRTAQAKLASLIRPGTCTSACSRHAFALGLGDGGMGMLNLSCLAPRGTLWFEKAFLRIVAYPWPAPDWTGAVIHEGGDKLDCMRQAVGPLPPGGERDILCAPPSCRVHVDDRAVVFRRRIRLTKCCGALTSGPCIQSRCRNEIRRYTIHTGRCLRGGED